MAAGVNVTFGHDCVIDPWYALDTGDKLRVAHMGLYVAQMTIQKGIRDNFDAVAINTAKVMHLQGYGLEVGCDASFVLLQARDAVEAIRLRANRLKVRKKGQLRAHTQKLTAMLQLPKRPGTAGFMTSRGLSAA